MTSAIKTGLTYRVIGRYMSGSSVVEYAIADNNGRKMTVTKDRLIYMIGKGKMENVRIQANGNEMIIRGKGVNLRKLPAYDIKNGKIRGEQGDDDSRKLPGQIRITRRIMYKTRCLGYMVEDQNGRQFKLSREQTIGLARQKFIDNATVQRWTDNDGSGKTRLILRGKNCNLSELPVVLVDREGNIIDPNSNNQKARVRATKIKRGGIIYNKENGAKTTFNNGDYLLCTIRGNIIKMTASEMKQKFTVDKEASTAVGDDYLENIANNPIEIFGSTPKVLTPDQIKRWAIVKPID